ncbi:MAG: hypothetical protein DSY76_04755 [Bacteroidetes bacterium]|nr:MAG: hypothetical protein DSY76_04755 [Bacteroidota bacterium]
MKQSINRIKFIAISILFVNIFLFSACKKDVKTYEISGSISDPQLHINVSGVKVSLKASKVQSGVYNPTYTEIQSTTTSSDGSFSFTVEHENVEGYRLDFTKTDYFDNTKDLSTDDVQNGNATNIKMDFIPIAKIKLIVKNTSPQSNDDKIEFRFSNVSVKGKDCWTNDPITGIGPTYSFTKTGQVSGNKDMYLEWVVVKNGSQHSYTDTIHSEAFKLKTYNINY